MLVSLAGGSSVYGVSENSNSNSPPGTGGVARSAGVVAKFDSFPSLRHLDALLILKGQCWSPFNCYRPLVWRDHQ